MKCPPSNKSHKKRHWILNRGLSSFTFIYKIFKITALEWGWKKETWEGEKWGKGVEEGREEREREGRRGGVKRKLEKGWRSKWGFFFFFFFFWRGDCVGKGMGGWGGGGGGENGRRKSKGFLAVFLNCDFNSRFPKTLWKF